MHEHSAFACLDPVVANASNPAPPLSTALTQALLTDSAEEMGLFGRWWCDAPSGQWVLSTGAANLLDTCAGWHRTGASCFEQVLPDDVLRLMTDLDTVGVPP
jgi:hypothetical protein